MKAQAKSGVFAVEYISVQTRCVKTQKIYEYIFSWSQKSCLEIYEIIDGVHFSVFHHQPQNADVMIENIRAHHSLKNHVTIYEIKEFFMKWIERSSEICDPQRTRFFSR